MQLVYFTSNPKHIKYENLYLGSTFSRTTLTTVSCDRNNDTQIVNDQDTIGQNIKCR